MATPRQKDTGRAHEVVCDNLRRTPTGRAPITFKLRNVKIIRFGEDLKRIYRIRN